MRLNDIRIINAILDGKTIVRGNIVVDSKTNNDLSMLTIEDELADDWEILEVEK